MKKTLFFLMAMFFGSYIAFSQVEPGTLESIGGGDGRGITANGLTQLYSVSGHYFLSADGAGSNVSTYTIDINKPSAGATVYQAYLMCAPVWGNALNTTQLDGVAITWDGSNTAAWGCCNYYDDVTAIVTNFMVGKPVGISSIPLTEFSFIDGYALLVVFADPTATHKTIVIMFGGLSTTGDNFSITLGAPIDPLLPGVLFNMGLGISFGFQGGDQYSIVDINGTRLTTSAGGQDDGEPANGALITVGGIGDINTNPVNPFALPVDAFSDDELYSLLPLITNTTVNILVNTLNPSNNDNVFLSYFEISGTAIIGEGILLSQTEDTNFVGTNHTVMALVQDNLGNPVVGTLVDFTVTSGPNAGATHSEVTDANGHAFFTYAGTGGVGMDLIEACFTDSQGVYGCSNILEKEWITGTDVPLSNWALIIGIMLILAFAAIRFRRIL